MSNKPIVNRIRTESSNLGTFSKFIVANNVFSAVELPWEDNEPNISCIPYGEYECEWIESPHFGGVYEVKNVPGRTHILIHIGNWAGDTERGYMSDSDGCIILGSERAVIQGQKAVASSKSALTKFYGIMEQKPFTLVVSGFDVW